LRTAKWLLRLWFERRIDCQHRAPRLGVRASLGSGAFILAPQTIITNIRQIPGDFEARIALFDRLGQQQIAFVAGKRRSKPAVDGTAS
jgi:hypothetical protein